MDPYLLLRIECPEDREEALLAALYSLPSGKCLGIEQGSWFEPDFVADSSPDASTDQKGLLAYFEATARFTEIDYQLLRDLGATVIDRALEDPRDWHAAYRRQAQPLEVGNGFVLDPREPSEQGDGIPIEMETAGRRLLKLPARQAFGSGSHATTQLMVEGIERLDLERRTVLDVGVGSGVLSLIAQIQGAARVQACDIDILSAIATRDNAQLNRLACPQLFVGRVDALCSAGRFDCVLVNVLEDRIASSMAALQQAVAAGGDLLVSGCLAENRERVEALWQTSELEIVHRNEKEDWLLLHLKRAGRSCRP